MTKIDANIDQHKIVFLFSGQGSHYRGMGEELYRNHPVFAQSIRESDELIEACIGRSLIDALYESKDKTFDDLLMTHPAIVAIEIAMLAVLDDLGIQPDYVAGNSLGEFAAAVANGILTKEMAIEMAIEQAKAIVQNSREGGMLALINERESAMRELLVNRNLFVASTNFSKHFTLAGEKESLDELEVQLKKMGKQYLRLPVSHSFHSPLIDAGKDEFLYYAYTANSIADPQPGFVSGLFAKEVDAITEDYFWEVISRPTNFIDFVNYMEKKGPCFYLDLGPSGTSTVFVKYNLPETSTSVTHQIMSGFRRETIQLEALNKLLATIQ